MNKIYVVAAYGGQYDDAWDEDLFACLSNDAAELAILELKERDERIKAAMPKLYDQWRQLCQETPLEQEDGDPYPKGPAKQTKENRAEHARVMAEHSRKMQGINARNKAKQIVWTEEVIAKQRAFAAELGLSETDMEVIGFPAYSRVYSPGDYMVRELEIK